MCIRDRRGAASERGRDCCSTRKGEESGYRLGRSFFERGKREESKLGGGAHARKSGLKICDARELERVSHELERGSRKTFQREQGVRRSARQVFYDFRESRRQGDTVGERVENGTFETHGV